MNNILLGAFSMALCLFSTNSSAQLIINEGSNRNYSTLADENSDYPDWIELYNAGTDTIHLLYYSLTDDASNPTKWVFPNVLILPNQYKSIFCSDKNRKPITGFKHALNTGSFNPVVGWNTHNLSDPFYWDGISNILINTCSYSSTGYTINSVFNQTPTPYYSTVFAFQDGSPFICETQYGTKVKLRPNMKINGAIIGTDSVQNSPYDYPAPYGNWYWAAKNQMIIPAAELLAAGVTAGTISSISFDVAATDPNTVYDYIDFNIKLVSSEEVTSFFEPVDTSITLHTNFKIQKAGDTVYLYSPSQVQLSALFVNCDNLDNSTGCFPDASSNIALFEKATPSASNNQSDTFAGYLLAPSFSTPQGLYNAPISVSIDNPNGSGTHVHYTLDGSDPTPESPLYAAPINIFYSNVLKARAFANGVLSSPIAAASYLLGINHVTPVLSVITDNKNLYGPSGIFDNWPFDWEKEAYVEYFDTAHHLVFSQNAAMQIDGGAGGSRSNPQHSFRIGLDDNVLGEGPVYAALIPNKPERTKYSALYLRNGSNQYLVYPYKDACQVTCMGGETNNYYSAWRPITVYINGTYFGLYELREKFDAEFFEEADNATADSIDILSQSYWYGAVLRPVKGSLDAFYDSYSAFKNLDTANPDFWSDADKHFDMTWYNDYIIGESWMGNTDWPGNNIKIYRSDKTDYRWRFCLLDMELSLAPNAWTDANFDHIHHMLTQDASNPYINIWLKGLQNPTFRNYFINRYADVMNTAYHIDRLIPIENNMFVQTALEMPKEYQRWGDPNRINQQMADFTNNHLVFQGQLAARTEQVRSHIVSNFNLTGQVSVTLSVSPPGAGKVKISTILPGELPWTGVYFDGNPVKITALPNPGYTFAYWDANTVVPNQNTQSEIDLNINADAVFNAVFSINPNAGQLVVSELNYHADSTRNAGDWVEFHNRGNTPLNISGWVFSDSTAALGYTFPAGTIVAPDGWLVLVGDTQKFESEHPGVQFLGPIGFGFSNSGETIKLFDDAGATLLEMQYDDSKPWPSAADGYGRTLEAVNDTLSPSIPENWFAGCVGGSPGGPYQACTEALIFSEINYNAAPDADAGDWIEIMNTAAVSKDLSGWIFSDNLDTHRFTIPAGTVLPATGYLVLYEDSIAFKSRFPNVTNATGPFNFGLSGGGEAIRLFDAAGRLYHSVVYDDVSPWPSGAAGNGYTLQIIDPEGNVCDGTNWMDGCPEGSPGGPFLTPCPTTQTAAIASAGRVTVFPNPSRGQFSIFLEDTIRTSPSTKVEVFTTLGTQVYSKIFSDHQEAMTIEMSGVPDGFYFILLRNGHHTFSEKIVVHNSNTASGH